MNADLRALFKPPLASPPQETSLAVGPRLLKLWRAKFFSPKDFVRRAIIISCFFALAHLFGLKEFTSVLNGTAGSVALGWTASAILGLTYVFLYVAFILFVPIFLLAAGMLSLWERLFRRAQP
jgi:hypothetical protein